MKSKEKPNKKPTLPWQAKLIAAIAMIVISATTFYVLILAPTTGPPPPPTIRYPGVVDGVINTHNNASVTCTMYLNVTLIAPAQPGQPQSYQGWTGSCDWQVGDPAWVVISQSGTIVKFEHR